MFAQLCDFLVDRLTGVKIISGSLGSDENDKWMHINLSE